MRITENWRKTRKWQRRGVRGGEDLLKWLAETEEGEQRGTLAAQGGAKQQPEPGAPGKHAETERSNGNGAQSTKNRRVKGEAEKETEEEAEGETEEGRGRHRTFGVLSLNICTDCVRRPHSAAEAVTFFIRIRAKMGLFGHPIAFISLSSQFSPPSGTFSA